jgi:hypothetical protein
MKRPGRLIATGMRLKDLLFNDLRSLSTARGCGIENCIVFRPQIPYEFKWGVSAMQCILKESSKEKFLGDM